MSPLSDFPSTESLTLLWGYKSLILHLILELKLISLPYCHCLDTFLVVLREVPSTILTGVRVNFFSPMVAAFLFLRVSANVTVCSWAVFQPST